MGFIKVIKNRAYFKRYQVKPRRRREGKTDYRARRALVIQDKDKLNAPKNRFVVRCTNKKIICQVIFATLTGDRVLCAADSTELAPYGIKVGLTNYAAAYATGLLLSRRLLKSLKLDETFEAVDEVTGEYEEDEEDEGERRPFKCFLDVGLTRTTRGNRVFGAMKGACDGGLVIPHNVKRFPGYDKSGDSYDATAHRARIFGLHVRDYMRMLQEENPDKYKSHFSHYIKAGMTADNMEEIYGKAHKGIIANPDKVKITKPHLPVCVRDGQMVRTSKAEYPRLKKLSCEERKKRVFRKIQIIMENRAAAALKA
eukprot:Lankesteria_metandrocarpae@DN844_c0_g1_i1.p1